MGNAWLCTRETVARALDINSTANTADQLDRACAAATETVEDYLRVRVIPENATRYFEWPRHRQHDPYWEADLGRDQVITVTTATAGGTTLTGYYLEPNESGPPYSRLEMPRTGTGLEYGDTPQRNLVITGVFGIRDDRVNLGTLPANLTDSATTVTLTSPAGVGVGTMLVVNGERMVVTAKTYVDTTANLDGALTASMSDTAVTVTDATGFTVGEYILTDSERMRVDQIAGTTLTVRRAEDGTVLAAHADTTDVYAARQLTITRGAHGTTAAAHTLGDTVERWNPPPLLESLGAAEAILIYENERAGWARTIGSGDSEAEARGVGVTELRKRAFRMYGRRARMLSV